MKSFEKEKLIGSTPEQIRNASWDTRGKDWEYTGKRDPILAQYFERFYQDHKGEFRNVLDIGCGKSV